MRMNSRLPILLVIAAVALGANGAYAQLIDQGRIGPPLDPGAVIQQQNRPQNLPPAMAPQPYEFRVPSSGPYPSVNTTGGSSQRARQVSRQRYLCSRKAKRLPRSQRASYIRGCVDG